MDEMFEKIETTINYHANRAVRTCRALNRDDVRQTLYEKAIRIQSQYDASKGAVSTFFSRCCHNTVVDCQRAVIEENANLFFTDFLNVDLSYNPMRKIHADLYLDDVDAALRKQSSVKMRNAQKVFQKLRLGWSQKDCAEYYKWSKGYVSRLVNECIIPIGQDELEVMDAKKKE